MIRQLVLVCAYPAGLSLSAQLLRWHTKAHEAFCKPAPGVQHKCSRLSPAVGHVSWAAERLEGRHQRASDRSGRGPDRAPWGPGCPTKTTRDGFWLDALLQSAICTELMRKLSPHRPVTRIIFLEHSRPLDSPHLTPMAAR